MPRPPVVSVVWMVGVSRAAVFSTGDCGRGGARRDGGGGRRRRFYWPTSRARWPRNARWRSGRRTKATHAGGAPRGPVRAGIGDAKYSAVGLPLRGSRLPTRRSSSTLRPGHREQTCVAQQFVKIRLAAPGTIAEQRQQRRRITAGPVRLRVLNIVRECKVL